MNTTTGTTATTPTGITTTTTGTHAAAVAIASMHAMGAGSRSDFEELYTSDVLNREAEADATAQWLRRAFSELAWEVHDVVEDGDLVVVFSTMSGRHTGPFVAYGPDARVKVVFPPRGRRFAVTQTHWFRMREGKVAEHWANRDDLGMGEQLGWTPPTPVYLVRMLVGTRRARRAERVSSTRMP
jgi:predicted ester cyclase